MPVTLATHADIAAALKKLGATLDSAKTLEPARTADPELAKALLEVVKELSPGERKRLEATIGGGGGAGGTAQVQTRTPGASQVVARLPTKNEGKEPRIDANTPAVAAFLQRYDVDHIDPPIPSARRACSRRSSACST